VVRRKLYFVAALVPGKWRPRNPRVVDEDIERPVRFQKRSGKAVDGALAGEIERDHFRVPDFFEISPGLFDIAGADDDRPRFRENARGLQADTGVAAGYNCNLSPKVAAAKRLLAGRLRSESRSKGFCSVGLLLYWCLHRGCESRWLVSSLAKKIRKPRRSDETAQEEVLRMFALVSAGSCLTGLPPLARWIALC